MLCSTSPHYRYWFTDVNVPSLPFGLTEFTGSICHVYYFTYWIYYFPTLGESLEHVLFRWGRLVLCYTSVELFRRGTITGPYSFRKVYSLFQSVRGFRFMRNLISGTV